MIYTESLTTKANQIQLIPILHTFYMTYYLLCCWLSNKRKKKRLVPVWIMTQNIRVSNGTQAKLAPLGKFQGPSQLWIYIITPACSQAGRVMLSTCIQNKKIASTLRYTYFNTVLTIQGNKETQNNPVVDPSLNYRAENAPQISRQMKSQNTNLL